MRIVLTTHPVLSCPNGEKTCHTLERDFDGGLRAILVLEHEVHNQRVVERDWAGSLGVAAAWKGEGEKAGGAGEAGVTAALSAWLSIP